MLSPEQHIIHDSKEEQICSSLMKHFIPNWTPRKGVTYQVAISERHDCDFYLPTENAAIEYHPAVIRWYGAPGVHKRLRRLEKRFSQGEFAEITQLITDQITHEYYKRRRALMDVSPDERIRKMRLIVVGDYAELFQNVIKPYSGRKVNYREFRDQLEKMRAEGNCGSRKTRRGGKKTRTRY